MFISKTSKTITKLPETIINIWLYTKVYGLCVKVRISLDFSAIILLKTIGSSKGK